MPKCVIEPDVPGGPIMPAELRDIAGKSCPEIAWVYSDVTADGMSDLVLTAECGFFAAAQLRRKLVEKAGTRRRVIRKED